VVQIGDFASTNTLGSQQALRVDTVAYDGRDRTDQSVEAGLQLV
jgi:hypothetical protein